MKKFLLFFIVAFYNLNAQTIDASNFKVDKLDDSIHYSFNLSGRYFRLEMYVDKDAISADNLLCYTVDDNEHNDYATKEYPVGYRYSTWSYMGRIKLTQHPKKYILVLRGWETVGDNLMKEKILEYLPPQPPPPPPVFSTVNLKIGGFTIYDNWTGNLLYDSNYSSKYPQVTLKQGKSYSFKINVVKSGDVSLSNVMVDFFLYNGNYGTYPNVSQTHSSTNFVNFSTTETSKTLTFNTTVPTWDGFNDVNLGVAFHLDKNNNISEDNENDNIIVRSGKAYYPNSPYLSNYNIFSESGKLLNTIQAESEQEVIRKISNQLGPGNYIIKGDNGASRQKIR